MGNVERCDKTLPTNAMMYQVRKDATLRARWKTDLEGLARQFGLSREEYDVYRRLTIRLLSGHLLLFYLVPLTYFRFVDPRRHLRARILDTP